MTAAIRSRSGSPPGRTASGGYAASWGIAAMLGAGPDTDERLGMMVAAMGLGRRAGGYGEQRDGYAEEDSSQRHARHESRDVPRRVTRM